MIDSLIKISTLLQENNTVFVSLSVVLGLVIGSFLNVVTYRLPKMMQREWQNNCLELQGQPISDIKQYSLVRPRSACPHCGHMISALENIPVISYVILKGQCRICKAPINPRYLLVEALEYFLASLAGSLATAIMHYLQLYLLPHLLHLHLLILTLNYYLMTLPYHYYG